MDDVIYLTKDFVPVDKNDPRMAMVKVRQPDGKIVFGFPVKPVTNQLFHSGGKGSGHDGHKAIKGKVGGSLPKGASESVSEADIERPYRRWSEMGAYPSSDEDDPYDKKDDDFHQDISEPFENRLNRDQMTAISNYADGNYSRINRPLRDPDIGYGRVKGSVYDPDGTMSRYIESMDSSFDLPEAELSENIILYRGTQFDQLRREETINLLKAAKNPNLRVTYNDLGYFSASVSDYAAEQFGNENHEKKFNVFFEIQMPKGARVIPVGSVLAEYPEQEMILPRNSRFEILHYTDDVDDLPDPVRYDAKIIMRLIQ